MIEIYNFTDTNSWIEKLVKRIGILASETISECGKFRIVLTGGTTPLQLYNKLCEIQTDWHKWHFWTSDERMPINGFSDFNAEMIMNSFIHKLNIESSQLHFIPYNNSIEENLKICINSLEENLIFDLVLLGIGEDGHVASLFPDNSHYENEQKPAYVIHNSPKPPSTRITLSAKRLSKAKHVFFLVNGLNKKAIVDKIVNSENLPMMNIKGSIETALFYAKNDS